MTNPLFPQGYDLVTTPHQYDEIGSTKTIKDQLKRPTFYNLDYEIQRRFVALQLDLYEHEGVRLGPGTGQRDSNPEVATGSSYHQPIPFNATNKKGARAIDTVGLPTHAIAWAAMQKGYLNKYGFCSFKKGTNQFNFTGIPANVKDDQPHIQAYEDRYSRPLFPPGLKKWKIPQRYDLDFLSLENPLPSTGEDEDMTNEQFDKMMAALENISTQLSIIYDTSLNPKLDAVNQNLVLLKENNDEHWDRHHVASGEQ